MISTTAPPSTGSTSNENARYSALPPPEVADDCRCRLGPGGNESPPWVPPRHGIFPPATEETARQRNDRAQRASCASPDLPASRHRLLAPDGRLTFTRGHRRPLWSGLFGRGGRSGTPEGRRLSLPRRARSQSVDRSDPERASVGDRRASDPARDLARGHPWTREKTGYGCADQARWSAGRGTTGRE